jgi:drug/metabolite transporter (DMT)-like permease
MSQPDAAPTSRAGSAWIGVALIVITLACWTSIPLFLRHFREIGLDLWAVNGWRYAFSAFIWLPVLVWHARRGSTPAGLWRAALVPSIFNAVAQMCFGMAPAFIDPGLMTFALRLQVIFLMFGAAAFFPSERSVVRTPHFIAGISMLIVGTGLTLWFKEGGLGRTKSDWGIVLAVSSGLLYAAYALSVRKFMHGIPALTAFAAVSQYTGAALLLVTPLGSPRWGLSVFEQPAGVLTLLAVSAVVGIGIGHSLYYASIQKLGLAVSSGVVQLQPVTVSIVSMILFSEKLNVVQWIAGLAAVGGAVLMLWAQQRLSRRGSVPENPAPARSLSRS